jgi:hypothetical protein
MKLPKEATLLLKVSLRLFHETVRLPEAEVTGRFLEEAVRLSRKCVILLKSALYCLKSP